MKILVCGGRAFGNPNVKGKPRDEVQKERNLFHKTMLPYWENSREVVPNEGNKYHLEIISGMAPGADTLAVEWAKLYGLKLHEYPADWAWHGKGAGAIRNRQMLNEGKPDLVVAFPGGVGTYHMISIAKRAGVPVVEIEGPYRGEVSY